MAETQQSWKTLSTVAGGEKWIMHPDRALFWPAQEVLIIADVHLGKAQHFRKNGLAVPATVGRHNIQRLKFLVEHFTPREVIFLGDLFHSLYNVLWEEFATFVREHNLIHFSLVPGNHDVLDKALYHRANIALYGPLVEKDNIILSHYPLEDIPETHYNLAGHIHPAVRLRGKGAQALTLPCFYFGQNNGILPAFGAFTGLARIYPRPGEQVFVIADNTIRHIQ